MEDRLEHPDDDRLQAWAEGDLAAEDAERVSRHADGCPSCQKSAEAYRALFADLAGPVPSTPPELHAGVMEILRREAAPLAARPLPALGAFWRAAGVAAAASAALVALVALDLPGEAWAAFPGLFAGADQAVPWLASLLERAGDGASSASETIGAGLAASAGIGQGWTEKARALAWFLPFLAAAAGLLNLAGILRLRRSAAGREKEEIR